MSPLKFYPQAESPPWLQRAKIIRGQFQKARDIQKSLFYKAFSLRKKINQMNNKIA